MHGAVAGHHDKWIRLVLCRCADGRSLGVKLTLHFKNACTTDVAEARAQALSTDVKRTVLLASTIESVRGREAELARQLTAGADRAHDIYAIEIAFHSESKPLPESGTIRRSSATWQAVSGSMPPRERAGSGSRPAVVSRNPDSSPPSKVDRRSRVFLVHADLHALTAMIAALGEEFQVLTATSVRYARTLLLSSPPFDVVIASHELPDGSGLELLDAVSVANPDGTTMILTTRAAYPDATRAMRDMRSPPRLLLDPVDPVDLLSKVRGVVALVRMRQATSLLHGRSADGSGSQK
jgi:CheY-like chemotaxis protein